MALTALCRTSSPVLPVMPVCTQHHLLDLVGGTGALSSSGSRVGGPRLVVGEKSTREDCGWAAEQMAGPTEDQGRKPSKPT